MHMGFKANRLLGISSYSIHSSVKCAALVNINNALQNMCMQWLQVEGNSPI